MDLLCRIFSRIIMFLVLILALILFQWSYRKAAGQTELFKQQIATRESVVQTLYRDLMNLHKQRNELSFWEIQEKVRIEAEITAKQAVYDTACQSLKTLRDSRKTAATETVSAWRTYGPRSIFIVLMALFFLPFLHKFIAYWGIARFVEHIPPVNGNSGEFPTGKIVFHRAEIALEILLKEDEKLLLRASDWSKKRTGVKARTRWMWSWRYPLVSFAADLCELLEFTREPDQNNAVVDITSPTPDIFIGRVDLNGGCLVLRPRHLVGMIGDVHIRTRWHFRIHNLLSGRIRQVELFGSGSILVAGAWGLEAAISGAGQESRIEDGLLVGYETGAEYSLCRTETFWHYYRGKSSLFDRRLTQGIFLTQNNRWNFRKANESFLERTINAALNGAGSLIGF